MCAPVDVDEPSLSRLRFSGILQTKRRRFSGAKCSKFQIIRKTNSWIADLNWNDLVANCEVMMNRNFRSFLKTKCQNPERTKGHLRNGLETAGRVLLSSVTPVHGASHDYWPYFLNLDWLQLELTSDLLAVITETDLWSFQKMYSTWRMGGCEVFPFLLQIRRQRFGDIYVAWPR